jgi:hypothetical protein
MSKELPELVMGWIERSYLKSDGWWAELVLDQFAFLKDWGYGLTGSPIAGVHFHQKGHYVCYHGVTRDVSIEYDPESEMIQARVVELANDLSTPFDELILRRKPEGRIPRRTPLDRPAIEENVRWWADGLRSIATEVL